MHNNNRWAPRIPRAPETPTSPMPVGEQHKKTQLTNRIRGTRRNRATTKEAGNTSFSTHQPEATEPTSGVGSGSGRRDSTTQTVLGRVNATRNTENVVK
ncbi:hypothetical protein C8R42DRAFT_716072 [Lentinula raphanica]|nr:hypothetical protein C8R42DRAFT_716072 [Lentinula raphanica]